MVERKKPVGEEYENFKKEWDRLDHNGKIALASMYEVTYDTAKHWISEGDTTPTKPIEEESSMEQNIPQALKEIAALKAQVNLDFVCFDIETTNFNADWSTLLCSCIKPFGQDTMVFRVDNYNKEWATNRMDDEGVVRATATELAKHAVAITHYGTRFDLPFLRAKMVKYGLSPLPPMFRVDTYSIARSNFKISSRRLKNLVRYFELGAKHEVQGELWVEAGMAGSKEALDEIVAHNILDVELLEKLASISFPYLKSIRKL